MLILKECWTILDGLTVEKGYYASYTDKLGKIFRGEVEFRGGGESQGSHSLYKTLYITPYFFLHFFIRICIGFKQFNLLTN